MNSLRHITLLIFLLGSSAVCLGGQMSYQNGEYNDNHQYNGNGLDQILKAVLAHDSTGHGQHTGSISNSNGNHFEITKQGFGSSQNSGYSQYKPSQSEHSGNGYQCMPASGGGLDYSNAGAQNGPHQYHNNNNGYQGHEYPSSSTTTFGNKPETNPGHSLNLGYQYDAPKQNYYESYQPPTNYNNGGYQYEKPQHQSSSTYSNFKGYPYLPAPSTSNTGYHYHQQHQGSSTGYQYESPKQSGYNYDKPQQSLIPESSFKGQSYLPLPPSSLPTHHNDGHNHGYSYDTPSTSFKGKPYLPLTPSSGGW